MDSLNGTEGLSSEISVEVLLRGVATLEQGSSKKVFLALRKGLENLVAQYQISPSTAKQFREMGEKILEKKERKMKIKVISSKVESEIWDDQIKIFGGDCPLTNNEMRTWCFDGKHITALLKIQSVGVKGMPLREAVYLREISGETPCDCQDNQYICEVEIGNIPRGFIPNEVLVRFGLSRRLKEGEFLVEQRYTLATNRDRWSVRVVDWRTNLPITENDLRDGNILRRGCGHVLLKQSVRGGFGEYHDEFFRYLVNKNNDLVVEDGNEEARAIGDADQMEMFYPFITREQYLSLTKSVGSAEAWHAMHYANNLLEKENPEYEKEILPRAFSMLGQKREEVEEMFFKLKIPLPDAIYGERGTSPKNKELYRLLKGAGIFLRFKKRGHKVS